VFRGGLLLELCVDGSEVQVVELQGQFRLLVVLNRCYIIRVIEHHLKKQVHRNRQKLSYEYLFVVIT